MLKINQDEIKQYHKLNLLSELHIVKSKIDIFEKKYNLNLNEFEKQIKEQNEDFEKWDDLMEWKGYVKSYQQIKKELEKVNNENFRVT